MQAIEFESVVQDQSIRLPAPSVLSSGQSVRVIVMFEDKKVTDANQAGDDLKAREASHPMKFSAEPLAKVVPHRDAISELSENPLVLPDFLPLSRDVAHER
jgi:hypothetical protein